MKKHVLIPVFSVMAVSLLAGCGDKHVHEFYHKHDEANHWMECECGEKQDVGPHTFTSSTDPHTHVITYVCDCGYSYTEDGAYETHSYQVMFDYENHWQQCSACGDIINKEAHDCELLSVTPVGDTGIIETYKCKHCDYTYTSDGSAVEKHNFKTTIRIPATCQEDGIKLYQCTDCSYSFEEPYSDYDAHKWDNGALSEGITTYHCLNDECIETKVVISHESETKAEVNVADLEKVGKLELKEATIDFGSEALAGLTNEITVGAEKVETSTISASLPETTKELIKDAPVFDFSMNNGDEEVHEFSSEISVSIPYALRADENPDNIGVVYIKENGETENIAAKYSNGFVSFKTNHFSYYAVIEMSREEACEILGHNYFTYRVVPSTCTRQGYTHKICKRCGESLYELLPLAEHHYVFSSTVPSSTTVHGYNEYACSECGDSYRVELPLAADGDDGFLLALAKSVMDGGIHYEVTETYDEVTHNSSTIISLGDKDSYELLLDDNKLSSVVVGNTKYNPDYRTYETNSLERTKSVVNAIKNLPSSLNKPLSYLENALYKICLNKTNKDGGVVLSFDKDVATSFFEMAKTSSCKDLFDFLFGVGTFDDVINFLEASFGRTIQETLDELKDFGIDSKVVFDFIKALPINITAEYDDIFTEDFLKSKGGDKLSELVGQTLSFSDFKAMIDEYADKTVIDALAIFIESTSAHPVYDEPVPTPFPTPEPEPTPYESRKAQRFDDSRTSVDDYINIIKIGVEAYIDSIDIEVNTTSNGQFLNASLSISEVEVKNRSSLNKCEQHVDENNDGFCDECHGRIKDLNNPDLNYVGYSYHGAKVSVVIDKNVSMGNYKNQVDELVNKCKAVADDFIIDENHPFIENVLEDYFGLDFKVEKASDLGEQYVYGSGTGYCYVSEFTDKYTDYIKNHQIVNEEIASQDRISGRIIIPILNHYYSMYSEPANNLRRQFSMNNYCLDCLDTNHKYLFGGTMFISSILYFELEGFDFTTTLPNNLYSNFNVYYDVDTEEFGYAPYHLLRHEYVYEKVTKREYEEYRGYKFTSYDNDIEFYKITCKYCDYLDYDYYYGRLPERDSYLRDSRMNEEAKKYAISIHTNNYRDNYLENDRYEIIVSDLYGFDGTTYLNNIGRHDYKDFSKTFGNVTISFEYSSRNNHECTKNENITISIDGNVIKMFNNIIHINDYVHYQPVGEYTEGCYDYCVENWACECCGQVLSTNTYIVNSHHDYVLIDKIDPTEAINGREFYECSICGSHSASNVNHHEHYFELDDEDQLYHCSCGATVEQIPYHDFVVEDVTYLKDKIGSYYYDYNEDCYIYAFADKMNSYIDFNSYQLVMVGVKDGEIDTDYMVGIGDDRIRRMYVSYEVENYGYTEVNFQGAWVEKETQDNFIASLPEGYEFTIAIIRYTNIDPVEKMEMDNIMNYLVSTFLGDPNDIYTIAEDDGDVYYYGNGITLDITISEVSFEEDILNLFIETFVPNPFYEYWISYDDGYVVGVFERYYEHNTYIVFEITDIEFDEFGAAHGTLTFEVFKEF